MNEPPEALLDELIFGEQAHQIFSVRARWTKDICHGRDIEGLGPRWFEGLPKNRIWDSRQWYEMPKEIVTSDELVATAFTELWSQIQRDDEDKNLGDPQVEATFVRWETWCNVWFNHWTWDTGLDDLEVLNSFQNYVYRTQEANRREGKTVDGFWQEPYCLMGAEDRYRWHGTHTGDPSERTDPPCRCSHCKKRGVITIGH